MVYFMENAKQKWMMWGYPYDFGNLHLSHENLLFFLVFNGEIIMSYWEIIGTSHDRRNWISGAS
jgi:hypothetical protein